MSYSCFYCSGGEEIFWEKKMLLRVHFWSHTGLNGQDLQLLEQQVFQCPWCFLVGWELYSALPSVHTAANREALSSTMQTTACSRSDQHLPVAALPEHMDKVWFSWAEVASPVPLCPLEPPFQPSTYLHGSHFFSLSILRIAEHPEPGS